ncbi:MAG: hypothetical protein AAFU73_16300 [Planctomycetota bacterium]
MPEIDPTADTPHERHVAWRFAVLAGFVLLAGLAWWAWSARGAGAVDPADGGAAEEGARPVGASSADTAADADPATAPERGAPSGPDTAPTTDGVEAALAAGRFADARAALDALEAEAGWNDAYGALASRIDRREDAHRRALRVVLVELSGLRAAEDGPESVFARASVRDTRVWATPWIDAPEGGDAVAPVTFAVRTSLRDGLELELMESGGMFGGPDRAAGPFALSPLANAGSTEFALGSAANAMAGGVATVRIAPIPPPGLHPDRAPSDAADGSTPEALLRALDLARERGELNGARALLARLEAEAPAHPDLGFARREVAGLAEALGRNVTRATFTLQLVALDPKTGGGLWADGGDRVDLRLRIDSGDDTLGRGDGRLAPVLVGDALEDPPTGNVVTLEARGDAPLAIVLTDVSPTFRSKRVGALDLGVTLADLATGTGTLRLESDPRVLIEPADEPNRLRSVVLRWRVER